MKVTTAPRRSSSPATACCGFFWVICDVLSCLEKGTTSVEWCVWVWVYVCVCVCASVRDAKVLIDGDE